MQHLDQQVWQQALSWCRAGETLWLCTVLASYGSSPRPPGAMLAALPDGRSIGSLSGGCVEEDFLQRLHNGEFNTAVQVLRYGESSDERERLRLPCGGILEVLIERLQPNSANRQQLTRLVQALQGQQRLMRVIDLDSAEHQLQPDPGQGQRVERDGAVIRLRLGPSQRLLIAGISPIAVICAEFAKSLGFEVIVCDPREEALASFAVEGVEVLPLLPSVYIANGGCHGATAVVALTHDPRIDDLAMIEAVRTDAYYIGVMGSERTSAARAERLLRSGGLSEMQVRRIRMPIGLAIGSRTPAEIALAVLADVLRVQNGRARDAL
ncbi:XshC-Cox1 family protein [Marinobacterium aestuarii]|uniref:XshC-Cox1 family protein n=1 Tax=Marinobacterium aestuarii TaxID=1821621 RepID=A0A1A9F1M2_9GAMM|nr:XdhC family protein [Marinobacterium aestuarii]ANG63890.1 XshC-Cox1 family protein [Marinobacterium aestuarii]